MAVAKSPPKSSIDVGGSKILFVSLEQNNPAVRVSVVEGALTLTAFGVSSDNAQSKSGVKLSKGDCILLRAAKIVARNSGKVSASYVVEIIT